MIQGFDERCDYHHSSKMKSPNQDPEVSAPLRTKEFPTLYTVTTVVGVRYWKISVIEDNDGKGPISSVFIRREYGKHGGKAIINQKLVIEAKSQSTVYEQALFEANKDWLEMQKKKGYVVDRSKLTSTSAQLMVSHEASPNPTAVSKKFVVTLLPLKFSSSSSITASASKEIVGSPPSSAPPLPVSHLPSNIFKFLPMLANKFTERKKYIKYPCVG